MKINVFIIMLLCAMAYGVGIIAPVTITNTVTDVATLTFTNGWSIACTSTNIQFIAP